MQMSTVQLEKDKPLPAWTLRPARESDCESIAALHLIAFPGFFISELGLRFATRLYRAFISETTGICLVAEDRTEGRLIGFVAGVMDPRYFFRRLRRGQGLAFALDALPALLRHPVRAGRRLARGLTYRGEQPNDIEGAALLSSIGVEPTFRGTGVARGLLEEFCTAAAGHGANAVYLTTDHKDNARANNFYMGARFQLHQRLDRSDGRAMNVYVRTL
jgi:ribosomal protein S18 acetylase RimI-like enzyme